MQACASAAPVAPQQCDIRYPLAGVSPCYQLNRGEIRSPDLTTLFLRWPSLALHAEGYESLDPGPFGGAAV